MSESISFLPFWDALTDSEKAAINHSVFIQKYEKGTVIHQYSGNCIGLNILQKGRARIFITSPEGDEITLCRLLEGEVCILSRQRYKPECEGFYPRYGRQQLFHHYGSL